ncbi:ACP S-malonyltransferase [Listeria sp. PSOL-1]|uniref:ACP S-malonyltransferase n=1 Tax=Listeria sp. PSOL-1 TaxID=1844999 RepID=UPI0013D0073A|nr:ACP S-malonyltransferase [Listeria sp. PSOL-1]
MNKVAFVFPGQGSQQIDMGQDVAAKYPEAKSIYNIADQRLGFSLTQLITEGPIEELTKSENAQPALVSTSIAILKALESYGVKADYVAGHSLGEYSALVAAGVLTFSDAVYLVHRRGELMEEAVPNGTGEMAAVLGMEADAIEAVTSEVSAGGDTVQIANYNSPGQIVISGTASGIAKGTEKLKEKGAKRVIPLAVSGPFHSKLMKPAAEAFVSVLEEVTLKDGAVPIVSNVDVSFTTDPSNVREKLIRQIYSPVKWEQTITALVDAGVDTFVEIGAGKVLSGLIKKINRDVTILSANDVESIKQVAEQLKEGK